MGLCCSSLVFYVEFCRSLFVLFLFAIVLSVLLRFTDSDCSFGIFKLFFVKSNVELTFYNINISKRIHDMLRTLLGGCCNCFERNVKSIDKNGL